MMKKVLLFMFITGISLSNHSKAETVEQTGIPIFQGNIKLTKDGRTLSYAFAAGDKILLKITTKKRKKISSATITTLDGTEVWKTGSSDIVDKEIMIKEDGIYTLTVKKKSLFKQDIGLKIIRIAGPTKDCNPAWRKVNHYVSEKISLKVDSAIGYDTAQIKEVQFKVFNKYYYQNISLYNHSEQVKGNLTPDGSHVKGFPMSINPRLVPKNAKFKCYNYSLNATLGGQKHWAIAKLASQVGGAAASIFLTPAAGFAIHGSMALIGPAPNKAPVMCYMSNRRSDIKTVGEMKSNFNKGKGAVNTVSGGFSKAVGFFNGSAGNAIKNATEIDTKNENDLDFTQKGNVTNLFVTSAIPPTEK